MYNTKGKGLPSFYFYILNPIFINKSAKTRQKFYKKRAKVLKFNTLALKIVREMRLELTQVLPH